MKKLLVFLSLLALLFAVTATAEEMTVGTQCTQHQYVFVSSDADHHTYKCSVCEKEFIEMHSSCDPNATECPVCGLSRSECINWNESHVYNTPEFSHDAINHWQTCVVCNEIISSEHAADCREPDVCVHCGCTVEEDGITIARLYHGTREYSPDYTDDFQHWTVCPDCGQKTDIATHYDYDEDGFCDLQECGHEIIACPGHQYELLSCDEYEHRFECSICHYTIGENHGSCDPNATECPVCGLSRSQCINWNEYHIYNSPQFSHDANNHWQTCVVCNEIISSEHAADCREPDVCVHCGCTVEEDRITIAQLYHGTREYSPDYADDFQHWTFCTDCGQKTDIAKHYDYDDDGFCDMQECGHEIIACPGHQYELLSCDEYEHRFECAICHFIQGVTHGSCDPNATECPVCGLSRSECIYWNENHIYDSLEFSHDENNHWQTCVVCNEIISSEHAADCCEPDVCVHCGCTVEEDGITITQIYHNTFEYNPDYSDDYQHWAICDRCEQKIYVSIHFDNDGDGFCDLQECGHEIIACPGHQYELLSCDEYAHRFECSICHSTMGENHGSCDPNATECPVCGLSRSQCINWNENHIYNSPVFSHDAINHWQTCVVCNETISSEHAADCRKPDVCVHCGCTVEEDGITISRLYHGTREYSPDYADDFQHWAVCTDCGQKVDIYSHYDDDEDGFCDLQDCGHEIIACPGHQYELHSCDEYAHRFECSICHDTVGLNHGSCDPNATECPVCGLSRSQCIDWDENHVYSSPKYNHDAINHWRTCMVCNEIFSIEHVAYCNEPDSCIFCGCTVEEDGITISGIYHGTLEYSPDYADDFQHWAVCTDCGQKTSLVAHYDYDGDGFCDNSDCGHIIIKCPGHHYEISEINIYAHIFECTVCHTTYGTPHGSCDPDATVCGFCGMDKDKCDEWVEDHVYGIDYEHDETSHWQLCKACGEKTHEENHFAYCNNPDVCINCGCTVSVDGIVPYVGHENQQRSPEYADDYTHWIVCGDCGEIFAVESHYDTDGDGYCDLTDCKHPFVMCTEHQYAVIDSDSDLHYFECIFCHDRYGQCHGSCNPDATECPTCGKARNECSSWDEGHLYNVSGHDANYDFQTCTVCNYTHKECHVAYCDNPELCVYCGCTVTEDGIVIGEVYHNSLPVTPEQADDYCHWSFCDNCGEISRYERHYDINGDGYCDEENCGHIIEKCPGHQYETSGNNEEVHFCECTICHQTMGATHGNCQPDATACAACGRPKEECITWSEYHISLDPYEHDSQNHWNRCMVCNKILCNEHAASCSNPTYCETCGCTVEDDGITIGYLYHYYSENSPDNADDYTHWQVCGECGESYSLEKHIDLDEDGYCDIEWCGHAVAKCTEHKYVVTSYNAENHRMECSICHEVMFDSHCNCSGGDTCLGCGINLSDATNFNEYHSYYFVSKSDEECFGTCLYCGETETYQHIVDCNDSSECLRCGQKNPVNPEISHQINCEDGSHTCIHCGSQDTWTNYDENTHTLFCCWCGMEISSGPHDMVPCANENYEYMECTICGIETDFKDHVSDGNYFPVNDYKHGSNCVNCNHICTEYHCDDDEDGICDICGLQFTPCAHPNMEYMPVYSTSPDVTFYHIGHCLECDLFFFEGEDHVDADNDGVCDLCNTGNIEICTHDYDYEWLNNGDNHYKRCLHCDKGLYDVVEDHQDEDEDGICDLCGGECTAGLIVYDLYPEYIALEGDTVSFTIAAEGTDLSYSWQYSKNGTTWAASPAAGHDTDTLSLTATASRNGYHYRCEVQDRYGNSVTSNEIILTVSKAVSITEQPTDQTVAVGKTVQFSVVAEGNGLTYQWQYKTGTGSWKNSPATGNKSAVLSVDVTATKNGYQYRCIVVDVFGIQATSNAATLTVANELKIASHPANVTAKVGETAKYTVTATGDGLTYQWQYKTVSGSWKNTTATGYNTATVSVAVTSAKYGYSYRCNVTDQYGNTVSSDAAVLTVKAEAAITGQPADVTAKAGETAKYSVTATGDGLTYQWQYKTVSGSWKNTTATGYNTKTVSIEVTSAKNGYTYRCNVTDQYGNTVTSDTAGLTVKAEANITGQPAAVTAKVGETAKYTVTATGDGLTYQWQYRAPGGSWKNTTATGYNTKTVSIAVTSAKNGYTYHCIVKDQYGNTVTSESAMLTVPVELKITGQPGNVTASIGGTAKYTVTATGDGLTYQWQYRTAGGSWKNTTATGYNTKTVSIAVTAAKNGYGYRCIITDASGNKVTSNEAKLTVAAELKITGQPGNVTASVGGTAKYTVTATGDGLTYQWQYRTASGSWKNTTATGYNTATVSIAVTAAKNGYGYRCIVTDSYGNKATSSEAKLTVGAQLNITSQPASTTAAAGTNAKFTVKASGSGLSYQWQYKTPSGSWKNTTATGCTTQTLTVAVTAAKNGYSYRCNVTDANGNKVTSGTATLTVK